MSRDNTWSYIPYDRLTTEQFLDHHPVGQAMKRYGFTYGDDHVNRAKSSMSSEIDYFDPFYEPIFDRAFSLSFLKGISALRLLENAKCPRAKPDEVTFYVEFVKKLAESNFEVQELVWDLFTFKDYNDECHYDYFYEFASRFRDRMNLMEAFRIAIDSFRSVDYCNYDLDGDILWLQMYYNNYVKKTPAFAVFKKDIDELKNYRSNRRTQFLRLIEASRDTTPFEDIAEPFAEGK